jgi:hypothetical protein
VPSLTKIGWAVPTPAITDWAVPTLTLTDIALEGLLIRVEIKMISRLCILQN